MGHRGSSLLLGSMETGSLRDPGLAQRHGGAESGVLEVGVALWSLGHVTDKTGGVQAALWNSLVKSQTQAAYPVISVKQECLQQLLGYTGIVLVCSGYHSSILSPRWLKQQTFIFSQF